MDNFASLDTPGDPRRVKVVELSGMKPKSADSVTVRLLIVRIFFQLYFERVYPWATLILVYCFCQMFRIESLKD